MTDFEIPTPCLVDLEQRITAAAETQTQAAVVLVRHALSAMAVRIRRDHPDVAMLYIINNDDGDVHIMMCDIWGGPMEGPVLDKINCDAQLRADLQRWGGHLMMNQPEVMAGFAATRQQQHRAIDYDYAYDTRKQVVGSMYVHIGDTIAAMGSI